MNNPFSKRERELPVRPELPPEEKREFPPLMAEWASPTDIVDGVHVEDVSEVDLAKRRGQPLSESQLAGIQAMASLAEEDRLVNEVRWAQIEVERLKRMAP